MPFYYCNSGLVRLAKRNNPSGLFCYKCIIVGPQKSFNMLYSFRETNYHMKMHLELGHISIPVFDSTMFCVAKDIVDLFDPDYYPLRREYGYIT